MFDTTTSLSDSNGESEMEASTQEPQENDCNQSNANLDELHQSPPGSPQTKRKRIPELTDGPDNTLPHSIPNNVNRLATSAISQINKGEESRSYYYSKYVGQCLDKLDADLNLEAREKISEILFKYEKVQLKRS